MKLLLNGREVDGIISKESTLGTALKIVQDQQIKDDAVISAVWVDGEPLTADTLSRWKDRPVADFQETRVDAPSKSALAATSLATLAEGLGESKADREAIVEHIHQGRSTEAMKLLPGYLGIWEGVQQSLSSIGRLLEIDLNSLELYSDQGKSDDWQPTFVVDQIHDLSSKLAEIKQALEASDLVLLGDVLAYEFADLTESWRQTLEELAERFAENEESTLRQPSLRSIFNRIFNPEISKSLFSQAAGITSSTGSTFLVRIIATVRLTIVNAKFQTFLYDLTLGQINQRGMNLILPFSFDRRFGGEIRQGFKRLNKCGPAIWIAAVIDGIDANKNIKGAQHFSPAQRQGQQYSISRRHISRRNL
jgi:hypothetical protein